MIGLHQLNNRRPAQEDDQKIRQANHDVLPGLIGETSIEKIVNQKQIRQGKIRRFVDLRPQTGAQR